MSVAGSRLLFLGVLALMALVWAQRGAPWLPLAVIFVVIPLLDAMAGRPANNVFAATPPSMARWPPLARLPLLLAGAVALAPALDAAGLVLFALALGSITGGIGITVAHELGNRAGRFDRTTARCWPASPTPTSRSSMSAVTTRASAPPTIPPPRRARVTVHRCIVCPVAPGFAHA